MRIKPIPLNYAPTDSETPSRLEIRWRIGRFVYTAQQVLAFRAAHARHQRKWPADELLVNLGQGEIAHNHFFTIGILRERRINDPFDSGEGKRGAAHQARLQGDVETERTPSLIVHFLKLPADSVE